MQKLYKILADGNILKQFVNDHNIKGSDLDYLYNKIFPKTYEKLRLIRSEKDSLLFSFEIDNSIQKVYQFTKEGKFFRLNIPSSVLNYINIIRQ